ncbi:hypothetical protein Lal_00001581 [Lupinus albus]|nr:hypothetical protein Lal_00001581 [Lupinus albus]
MGRSGDSKSIGRGRNRVRLSQSRRAGLPTENRVATAGDSAGDYPKRKNLAIIEYSSATETTNNKLSPQSDIPISGRGHQSFLYMETPVVNGNPNHSSAPNNVTNPQDWEKIMAIEERIKVIKEASSYDLKDVTSLCLVLSVVLPPKFKMLEFEKYQGTSCPKDHLSMYARKMTPYIGNDNLLIHVFQESLTGAAITWYTRLERPQIRCFKDLCNAFLKHYNYNIDQDLDIMLFKQLSKRSNETFREYVQRWAGLAAQVKPKLSDEESASMFINTLQPPFFDRMIGNAHSDFRQIIRIRERIENHFESDKIKKSFANKVIQNDIADKDMEEETSFTKVLSQPQPPYFPHASCYTFTNGREGQSRKRKRKSLYDPIPMSYAELLPQLFQRSLLTSISSKKGRPPISTRIQPGC